MRYFAYGSNMDAAQMQERCPHAILIGPAVLRGCQLVFNMFSRRRQCGVANIEPNALAAVHGVLYEIPDAEMQTLDKHEGHPKHYRKANAIVRRYNGKQECTAVVYIGIRITGMHQSSRAYIKLMSDAARNYGFPKEYQRAIESTPIAD